MKDLYDAVRPQAGWCALWRAVVAGSLLTFLSCEPSPAKEADWIWSPAHAAGEVPEGSSCCFRKTFLAETPIRVQATIAADDEYELYVNGQQVGTGSAFRKFDEYNITPHVKAGRNTIAVLVTNRRGPTAALTLRVLLREREGGWTTHSTDETWRTSVEPQGAWQNVTFNDRDWEPAQVYGPLGDTAPWDRDADVATTPGAGTGRFQALRDFEVQRVVDADTTGSLIAMAFNEFGHLIVSREGGGLALIVDTNDDGVVDDLREYGNTVTNVQGILPINGDVYVTGSGPDGCGLYCLSDPDRDGRLDATRLLFKFEGEPGEHSAHGLVLGPDGWIYIVLGNHTSPLTPYDPASPHRGYYEGDLVGPKYEDPGGHAAGRKAPGGMIIRTDLQGTTVHLVAGGLRNVYDLAFNADGEIFIHDSDMESDIGTTWYRPTRICHVIPGGEYGWRSGWSKWPEYYVDSLPAIADTGRSSPTGCVFYSHTAYPAEYRDALFLGDWSEGRILVAHVKRAGASYRASVDVFLTGQPLNVTDLEVSPDGWLYFVTGGRGTGGGVYRVVYRGRAVDAPADPGPGIAPAIRQPQLDSAWGRQQVARLRHQLREDWGPMLVGVARSTANPTYYRTRALDLMQLYGPPPDVTLLLELSRDQNETIRARAADALALLPSDETRERLLDLIDDSDRYVRRKAIEALARTRQPAPPDLIVPLLASDDRVEAWAARRLLEISPTDQWRDAVLTADNQRIVIQGALALLIAEPTPEHALLVLDRSSRLMNEFVSDRDFVDLLRVIQVALMQGKIAPDQVDALRVQLAEEFPAGDPLMNRELIRLLVYMQEGSIMDRYFEYLNSDASHPDKAHVAMYLRFLATGWTMDHKEQLFRILNEAKSWDGGSSYPLYLGNVARDFARQLTPEESVEILRRGAQWPDAALGALYKVPRQLDADLREALVQLDQAIDARQDPASRQLMVGIVAVLARSGDDASLAYLRTIWDRNPERREPVAMGLAQYPHGENWSYLIRSLPVLENQTAREVLRQLATVDQRSEAPEDLRQIILCGLRLGAQGATDALALLEHWTGQSLGDSTNAWQDRLSAWQTWFAESFPDLPDATLPVDAGNTPWKYDELLEYLTGKDGSAGDPTRGALVFQKATCDKCHRYGDRGEAMGPDLNGLTKRFTRKEILQSLLYPSHVISSQYVSQNVLLTDGRQILGIVAPGGEGEKIVLNSEGDKIPLREEDIDEIAPSKLSSMPDGLIKDLTLAEIADLFAYVSADPAQAVAQRPDAAPTEPTPREAPRPAEPIQR
ncbi:MAG: HEAT repeat domain-containing protein [Pirellulaceae bacterium]|nr:HEAT repeat domain-containing protein [Pirellulaceae bacterium]